MKKILIIEDDINLGETLKDYFEYNGYKVYLSGKAECGLKLLAVHNPNLIVLDVILPDMNGFEVIEQIRKTNSTLPVIFMTGTEFEEISQIKAYKFGAANYIQKPVVPAVILAQIENLLSSPCEKFFIFGKTHITLNTQRLSINNRDYILRERDASLIEFLLSNEGKLINRDDIIKAVWGNSLYKNVNNILDGAISRLKRLFSDEVNFKIIRTYGEGYTLKIK